MMDFCKQKKSMEEIVRRPLVPSEKTNASAAAHSSVLPNVRKLRTREVVGSRYSSGAGTGTAAGTGTTGMIGGTGSGSMVKRHPSPVSTRTGSGSGTGASMMVMPKRAQSAERRRPCATTPSLRSSAPSSPSAKTPAASLAASPSRHSTTTTAPGMHDSLVSAAARLQFSSQRAPEVLWPSMRSMPSSFQSEIISIPISKKESKSSSSSSPLNISTERERKRTPLRGRSTTTDHFENNTHHNSRPRAAVVDQHRWPRTTTTGPKFAGSPTALSSRGGISPRTAQNNIGRSDTETPLSLARSSRSMSLPSSPNKASSPTSASSRGMGSPFRTRPSTPFSPTSPSSSSPASANISDYRRLKKNPNYLEDAHQLRIWHVQYLQWRFVNARTEDSSSFQKLTMEDEVYNTWMIITDLHNSVASLKIHIQHLKQELKLNSILEEQMAYLHDYSLLENIHLESLSSAIAALQASTMRLPLSGRITANTRTLKNSINSAVDVMQSMGFSIHCFLSKVENTNSVALELANLAVEETYMLRECRELLVSTAAMQMQESTLRTHLLQLHNVCQRQSYSYYYY